MEQRPDLTWDFCGLEEGRSSPPRNCDDYVTAHIGCQSACVTDVGFKKDKGIFGICMRGMESGCPTTACNLICDCPTPEKECKEPCMTNCQRYENCMLNGPGGQVTEVAEFNAFLDQCVLEKPPPPIPEALRPPGWDLMNATGQVKICCNCVGDPPCEANPPPEVLF